MTTVGDSTGYPIWVPDDTTPITPLRSLFVNQANSIATQLGHLKAQSTSLVTKTSAFSPAAGWSVGSQSLTIVGEVMAYVYLSLTKGSGTISVPSDGNLSNVQVGSMDGTYNAATGVPLSSGSTGRGAHGYITGGGGVYLSAIVGGGDITNGTGISLGGGYPLAAPISSGL